MLRMRARCGSAGVSRPELSPTPGGGGSAAKAGRPSSRSTGRSPHAGRGGS
jgi:hypothetical protein